MKMARASQADVDAAIDVTRILSELEKGYMPSSDEDEGDETEFFDRDDPEQCQKALCMLLDAADKGSILRVTWGMVVVLDPDNELLDPEADAIEMHPKIVAALESRAPRTEVVGAVPEGWKLVPIEPTVSMVVDGFESWPDPIFSTPEEWDVFEKMTGCQQATHKARLCYSAMLAAAPQPPSADAAAAPADERAAFGLADFCELIDAYQCAQKDGTHDERAKARIALMDAYRAAASQPALSDAAITACALMIKGICITQPNEEWVSKIEARIRFMLDQAQTEKGNHDE